MFMGISRGTSLNQPYQYARVHLAAQNLLNIHVMPRRVMDTTKHTFFAILSIPFIILAITLFYQAADSGARGLPMQFIEVSRLPTSNEQHCLGDKNNQGARGCIATGPLHVDSFDPARAAEDYLAWVAPIAVLVLVLGLLGKKGG